MGVEIERKFLVVSDAWKKEKRAGRAVRYRQGYLAATKERSVRVRTGGGEFILAIKGETLGRVRAEFEYPIPAADAKKLLKLCGGGLVDKTRYEVMYGGLLWEIDVFEGDNAGLVVAEVELKRASQKVELPPWAGKEVTGEARYYNARLALRPYRSWKRR